MNDSVLVWGLGKTGVVAVHTERASNELAERIKAMRRIAYVGAPSHEQAAATPAMPPSRQFARLMSLMVRPGPLFDRRFASAFRGVSQGRSIRAARFEYAERRFGRDLIVEVDPARLKRRLIDVVSSETEHVRLAHWFLDGGEWERALVALKPSEVHQEMNVIFDQADRVDETPAYQQLLASAAAGRPQIHNGVVLATPQLIQAYFEHYRKLRISIEQHGFLQRNHVSEDITRLFARTSVRSQKAEKREREIGVAVNADGELVRMVGGHHRTAIAQRLGLQRIPVQVRLVHATWLGRQIQRTSLPPAKALVAGIRRLNYAVASLSLWLKGVEDMPFATAI